MATTFSTLFTDNVLGSFIKQNQLADLIGDSAWAYDAKNGTLALPSFWGRLSADRFINRKITISNGHGE